MTATARATLIFILSVLFAANSFAGDTKNSRLIPEDTLIVFQNGEKVSEYTREMPVPEDSVFESRGRTAIKLEDMYLIAEDQSRFSIEKEGKYRLLYVEKGTVYFGINEQSRGLVFITPRGVVSSQQVMLNASSGYNMLEGYVKVTKETSEVGVLEGGSMYLVTKDGQKMIKSGQSLFLAQANTDVNGERGNAGWWQSLTRADQIALIGVGGVSAASIYAIYDRRGSRDPSPSEP